MPSDEIRYSVSFQRRPRRRFVPDDFALDARHLAVQYSVSREIDVLNDIVYLHQLAREEEALRRGLIFFAEQEQDLERRALLCLYAGQSAERSGRFDDAIIHYTQALALEPCDPFAAYFTYNNLAYCLNEAGEYSRAEKLLYLALKIDPTRANAYKNLGISLEAQGDYKGAAFAWVGGTRANAADERSLELLERLAEKQPELRREIRELDGWLNECRCAVAFARRMHELVNDATADGRV